MDFYGQLKRLHKLEFYNDVKILAGLLLTLYEADPACFNVKQYYQILVWYGEALFKTQEHRKAESILKEALQVKRGIKREGVCKAAANSTSAAAGAAEVTGEAEVRLLLAKVYWDLKQYKDAAAALEMIAAKKRSIHVSLMLGQLYQRTGAQRSAITCYKEVLRDCPTSFEALDGLLSLGVKAADINSLLLVEHPKLLSVNWFAQLLNGTAMVANHDYTGAIATLNNLQNQYLPGNAHILGLMGEAHYYNGHYAQAKLSWQKMEIHDPYATKHYEKLAMVLLEEKKGEDLEGVATRLLAINDRAVEPWLVSGFFCLSEKKYAKALYLAQKVLTMKPMCYAAFLLKGLSLSPMNKMAEAIEHYREAMTVAPYRLESYRGLTEAYICMRRPREAVAVAASACRHIGSNARTLYIYGRCLSKERMNLEKAKSYLEKSLRCDSGHLPSVYMLVQIFMMQSKSDKAVELLRSTLALHSSSKLHQLLADCLAASGGDRQVALQHYHIALQLDSTNRRAREGIERLEKRAEGGTGAAGRDDGNGYDVDVMEDSEADVNESDMGSGGWSESELT